MFVRVAIAVQEHQNVIAAAPTLRWWFRTRTETSSSSCRTAWLTRFRVEIGRRQSATLTEVTGEFGPERGQVAPARSHRWRSRHGLARGEWPATWPVTIGGRRRATAYVGYNFDHRHGDRRRARLWPLSRQRQRRGIAVDATTHDVYVATLRAPCFGHRFSDQTRRTTMTSPDSSSDNLSAIAVDFGHPHRCSRDRPLKHDLFEPTVGRRI